MDSVNRMVKKAVSKHADDGGNPVTHDCLHDLCLTGRRFSHRRGCVAGVAAAAE